MPHKAKHSMTSIIARPNKRMWFFTLPEILEDVHKTCLSQSLVGIQTLFDKEATQSTQKTVFKQAHRTCLDNPSNAVQSHAQQDHKYNLAEQAHVILDAVGDRWAHLFGQRFDKTENVQSTRNGVASLHRQKMQWREHTLTNCFHTIISTSR